MSYLQQIVQVKPCIRRETQRKQEQAPSKSYVVSPSTTTSKRKRTRKRTSADRKRRRRGTASAKPTVAVCAWRQVPGSSGQRLFVTAAVHENGYPGIGLLRGPPRCRPLYHPACLQHLPTGPMFSTTRMQTKMLGREKNNKNGLWNVRGVVSA